MLRGRQLGVDSYLPVFHRNYLRMKEVVDRLQVFWRSQQSRLTFEGKDGLKYLFKSEERLEILILFCPIHAKLTGVSLHEHLVPTVDVMRLLHSDVLTQSTHPLAFAGYCGCYRTANRRRPLRGTDARLRTFFGAKEDNGYGQFQIRTVRRGIAPSPDPYGPGISCYSVPWFVHRSV